ncbi:MAG TPA: hypothetical protein PLY86_18865 [bacterium]|nr:hypothetical protein [bacterium]
MANVVQLNFLYGDYPLPGRKDTRSRHREERPGVCEGPRRGDLMLARRSDEISPFGRNDRQISARYRIVIPNECEESHSLKIVHNYFHKKYTILRKPY